MFHFKDKGQNKRIYNLKSNGGNNRHPNNFVFPLWLKHSLNRKWPQPTDRPHILFNISFPYRYTTSYCTLIC